MKIALRVLGALAAAAAILIATGCSNPTSAEEDSTAPDEIRDLSFSPGTTSLQVTWTDPDDEDLDYIEITRSPGGTGPEQISPGTQSYSVVGLAAGTEYSFTFRTADESGNVSSGVTESVSTNVPYSLEVRWLPLSGDESLALASASDQAASESPQRELRVAAAGRRISQAPPDREPTSLIVKYRDGVVRTQALQQRMEHHGTERSIYSGSGLRFSRIDLETAGETAVEEAIAYYESLPEVEYAEPNHYRYTFEMVNDEYFSDQWHFLQLEMPTVWNWVTGSEDVVVAVVDTGVAQDLSDFAQTSFVPGRDFVNDDDDPADDNSHGTHVAGTIAQSTNNDIGVAGMAWGVSIMPVKVFAQDGVSTISEVVQGVTWAVDNGADVINLSLGGIGTNQAEEHAMQYAFDNGVAVIAASGNEDSGIGYPAAYDDYVLAVGATRYDKQRAWYSNYGPELDVVAPGGDLQVDQNSDGYGDGVLQQAFESYNSSTGTYQGVGYYFIDGTSMATPHVSALAALMLSQEPDLTPDEIYTRIRANAEDLGTPGRDDYYGHGLIDPLATLLEEDIPTLQSRTDDLNAGTNPVDRWEFDVAEGPIEVELQFSAATASLDVVLLGPSNSQVAGATSTAEGKSLTHDAGTDSGTYTVEVRFAE